MVAAAAHLLAALSARLSHPSFPLSSHRQPWLVSILFSSLIVIRMANRVSCFILCQANGSSSYQNKWLAYLRHRQFFNLFPDKKSYIQNCRLNENKAYTNADKFIIL